MLADSSAISPTPVAPTPAPWARLRAAPLSLRLAAALWLLLVVAVGLRVAISPPGSQTVVPIYLHAGAQWDKSADLYRGIPGSDFYRYPPVVAVGFALVAGLPPKPVGVAWRLACAGLFLWGLRRARRECLPEWGDSRAGWWAVLAVVPAVPSLNNGQFNLVIAAAGLHALAACRRRRGAEAGLWGALAALVKLYPLSLGLLFGLRSGRRYWLALAAVIALGLALPYALKPASYVNGQYGDYLHLIRADDRSEAPPKRATRDWTVLVRAWCGATVPPPLQLGAGVVVGAAMAGCVLAARDRRAALLRGWALGGIWMTAFGPATEMNTYSILAATAPYLALSAAGRVARALAWAGYALLASAVLRGALPNDWEWHYLGVQALGALLLVPAAFRATTPPTPGSGTPPRAPSR